PQPFPYTTLFRSVHRLAGRVGNDLQGILDAPHALHVLRDLFGGDSLLVAAHLAEQRDDTVRRVDGDAPRLRAAVRDELGLRLGRDPRVLHEVAATAAVLG